MLALHDLSVSVSSSVKEPWMKDECNNAIASDAGGKLRESVNITAAQRYSPESFSSGVFKQQLYLSNSVSLISHILASS